MAALWLTGIQSCPSRVTWSPKGHSAVPSHSCTPARSGRSLASWVVSQLPSYRLGISLLTWASSLSGIFVERCRPVR